MRRHFTYANVAATLALVLAMSGGAMAAKHYLVSSTSQISPKVIKRLRGNAGADGKQGPQGIPGPAGKAGPAGQSGVPGPVSVSRVDSFEPFSDTENESNEFKFLGEGAAEHFNSVRTAADVTASVDIASSNGKPVELQLGVCFMPAGGSTPTEVASVTPEFEASEMSFFAQTVTGVVTDLAPGDYLVGACTAKESANVRHGDSAGTILVTETVEGGSRKEAPALRAAGVAPFTRDRSSETPSRDRNHRTSGLRGG